MGTHVRIAALPVALAALACLACGRDSHFPTAPGLGTGTGNAFDACTPDVTAPSISSVTASRGPLWPPNHKFVAITIGVAATDDCSPVTSRITSVASNEPVNGRGDGNTAPDWIVTGPLTVLLRSERSGLGSGRVYTIAIAASDAAGNTSTGATTVTVPHDQGKR